MRVIGPGLVSFEAPRAVSLEELDEHLGRYVHVEQLLGDHYRKLARLDQLTDDLLPVDWHLTESELAAVIKRISGFSAHQPVKTGQPEQDIYATLAEIEGFAWLLEQGYDKVQALAYRAIRGGTTPDASGQLADEVLLYEFKSFWAYWKRRHYQLKTFGRNTLVFGDRPVGVSVPDAERRRGAPLEPAEHNSLVVSLTVDRLLNKARSQLVKYATSQDILHCPKGILLVVTRRGVAPPLIREALRATKAWHARHPDITTVKVLPEAVAVALSKGV